MAVHFDGVYMPTDLAGRGELDFPPPEILNYDGLGLPIVAGTRSAIWKWRQITAGEADWILDTLLAGQSNRICDAGLRLYDPMNGRAETLFSYGVVIRPTWKRFVSNVYHEVELTIRGIQ